MARKLGANKVMLNDRKKMTGRHSKNKSSSNKKSKLYVKRYKGQGR